MKKPLKITLIVVLVLLLVLGSALTVFLVMRGKKASNTQKNDYSNLALKSVITNDDKKVISELTDNNKSTTVDFTNGKSLFFNFDSPVTLNTITLSEIINKKDEKDPQYKGGIKKFSIYADLDSKETLIYQNDKVESYRLCSFDTITTKSVKITFDDCRSGAKIAETELYLAEKKKKDFRVNDYIVLNTDKRYGDDEEFKQYLDSVTDLTLFIAVRMGGRNGIRFNESKEIFEERLADIKKAVGDRDIKLYCNILSEGPDASFFTGKTELFAKGAADFLVQYDLDGVDIDWEYPQNAADWKEYNNLVIDMHKAFQPIGKKVTVATAAWSANFSTEAREAIDYYNVMIYDLTGSDFDNYHATFQEAVADITTMLNKGYKSEKLLLGVPFYGREIRKSDPDRKATWTDYTDSGITTKWDNVKYTIKGDGTKIESDYFNGYALMADKTAYAIAKDLGGMMIWQMDTDMPMSSELSLHRAIGHTINERILK
ncbi:MAG: glycosyl hydrolase family 18 protein [Oscillospiraceae bacterium]